MKRIVLSLATFAAFVATTAFATQDEWVRQVRRMLVEAGHTFEERGFELTHELYTGSLDDDETDNVTLRLEIGTEYYIMGACDTDCDDLDLTLYDAAGNELDSDLQMDDFPVVHVTPRRSGNYRVHVSMASCTREPCRYGIGAFGK